jgi:fatty-acyl-CoA synthase
MKEQPGNILDYSRYEGQTFGQILDGLAHDVPDKEMIMFKDERMTYGQFYQKVTELAMALKRLGIKKGDRVAALFPNCPDFFVVQQATLYIGAVFVLLSTRYREYELSYMMKHSGARCLFTIDEYLKTSFVDIIEKIRPELPNLEFCFVNGPKVPAWARPYQEALDLGKNIDEKILREDLPKYEDVASILYTSGSTGLPQGLHFRCHAGDAQVEDHPRRRFPHGGPLLAHPVRFYPVPERPHGAVQDSHAGDLRGRRGPQDV